MSATTQSTTLFFVVCMCMFAAYSYSVAATEDVSALVAGCVKVSVRGDASTYNPNYAGWKTGGQSLATGGRYNPNAFEAALQLDLAKKYKCGYGSGAICHAIVQAPNGKSMLVRINDNGPLVPGRIIDLNEMSMRYISGGVNGKNSGVVKNVTVTLLCAASGMQLGPLDPNDRAKLAALVQQTMTQGPVGALSGVPTMFGGPSFTPNGATSSQLGGGMFGGAGLSSSTGGGGQQTNTGSGFASSTPQQQGGAGYQQYVTSTSYQYPDTSYTATKTTDSTNATVNIACTSSGGRTRVQWSCPAAASVSRGLASPRDSTFTTRGALAGIVPVQPSALTTYTVQCIQNQQIIGQESCKLKPATQAGTTTKKQMVLSISATPEAPATLRKGKRAVISWSTIRATACTVTGEGLAADGDSGEEQTDPLTRAGTYAYTLECENASGDTETARTRVEVR